MSASLKAETKAASRSRSVIMYSGISGHPAAWPSCQQGGASSAALMLSWSPTHIHEMLVISAVGMSGTQYDNGRFSMSKSRMRRSVRFTGDLFDEAVERARLQFEQSARLEFERVVLADV